MDKELKSVKQQVEEVMYKCQKTDEEYDSLVCLCVCVCVYVRAFVHACILSLYILIYTVYIPYVPYSGLISRGKIFVDWIVKTFCGYLLRIITRYALKTPFHQMNSIIIPSVECLKFFVVKISRIEQNP